MPSRSDDLATRIAEMARVVHADESLDQSLRRVAEAAVNVIPRCDAASVSMYGDGRIGTWVSTHPAAERVDLHQYQTGEGPCLDAIRSGQAQFVDSLASDRRWPTFAPRAVAEGMVATYSLPLARPAETVGALNLYSRSRPFAYRDLRAAEALAVQAVATLSNARDFERARDRIAHLEGLLARRRDPAAGGGEGAAMPHSSSE